MVTAHLVLHGDGSPKTTAKEFETKEDVYSWLRDQSGHPWLYYTLNKIMENDTADGRCPSLEN